MVESVRAVPGRIAIAKCGFLRRGEVEYPEENLSEQGREPKNKPF